MSKIMRVYYDNAGLPYKDSALSILYPIVGSEFTGANNTTEIHFYCDNLGQATWVANCKLPNGDKLNRLLISGVDGDGLTYQSLPLDSELTSIKGHLKIGLNGYAGNISIDEEELENNDLVVISGTPTIIATGIIDIAMNYSPIVIPVSDLTPSEYQQLLGLIATKTNKIDTILVVSDISSLDAADYGQSQIIYDRETKLFYQVISGEFVLEEFDFVSAETFANALLTKVDKSSNPNIVYGTDNDGNQITIPVETYSGSVVRKNASGQVIVPTTPTENTNAASKGYVDTFAKDLVVSIDSSTYVVTFTLKDDNNNTLATQTIDLPLESVVVNGSYDDDTKSLILTLNNGNTITIPVSDLVDGLVSQSDLTTILENYAKVDGYYQTMTVGLADNLTTTEGITDTTPFVFQSSGGEADITTGYANLKSLRGNTVVFNQLLKSFRGTQTKNGITFTDNQDGSYTLNGTATADAYFDLCYTTNTTQIPSGVIVGHKYLLKGCYGGSSSTYYFFINTFGNDNGNGIIREWTSSSNQAIEIRVKNGITLNNVKVYPQLFDLTIMPLDITSVLEFNRLFPKLYYPYNAGTLLSCQSSAYKIVGYNQFDGELEIGGYYTSTGGDNNNATDIIRTKSPIKVITGQTYTLEIENLTYTNFFVLEYDENLNYLGEYKIANPITLELNCHYIKFMIVGPTTIPTNPQIAFHLTWSGSKTGYEEYYTEIYDLPNIELKSAGSAYDEITYDGKLIRRIGVVDLGTLNWLYDSSNAVFHVDNLTTMITQGQIICSKYLATRKYPSNIGNKEIATMRFYTQQNIVVKDTSYTDVATFKTAMSGVYLYYELATPTETQDDNYVFQELTKIDDYGTQEFISSQIIQIPQGAEFTYLKNLKDFLRRIGNREDIDYDPEEIVSQTQLANYLKTITGYDATKTQTLKNVNGVLTWVDD